MKKSFSRLCLLVLALSILVSSVAFAEPQAKSFVLSKFSVPVGVGAALEVQMADGSALPADLQVTTKSKKIATAVYENDTWSIVGVKKGTTKVTVSSVSLNLKKSVNVKVVKNEYKFGKPYKGGGVRNVISSIKRMYAKGSYLYVDIYLYNALGYVVRNPRNFTIILYERDSDMALATYIRSKKIKKTLGKKKSMVMTAKFPFASVGKNAVLKTGAANLGIAMNFEYTYLVPRGAELVGKSAERAIPWAGPAVIG